MATGLICALMAPGPTRADSVDFSRPEDSQKLSRAYQQFTSDWKRSQKRRQAEEPWPAYQYRTHQAASLPFRRVFHRRQVLHLNLHRQSPVGGQPASLRVILLVTHPQPWAVRVKHHPLYLECGREAPALAWLEKLDAYLESGYPLYVELEGSRISAIYFSREKAGRYLPAGDCR